MRLLSSVEWPDQTPVSLDPVLKNLIGCAQNLKLDDTLWSVSIFDGSSFDNLLALDIDIYPNEVDFSMLSALREVKTLKELHFSSEFCKNRASISRAFQASEQCRDCSSDACEFPLGRFRTSTS